MKSSHTTFLSLLCTLPLALSAAAQESIPLWPGGAPGEHGELPPETDLTKPSDGNAGGKRVARIGNVSVPTLTVYRPANDHDSGAAVVVCPGGGYSILALDLEGTEVCEWLNKAGVTGILLKYRVPTRQGDANHTLPLQDAQRAIGLARMHAADWHLDPKRIGILGFSAGGHLAAHASTQYGERAYPHVDAADDQSCRPDFTILVYPAYLTNKDAGDQISPELSVTKDTPPAFLVQTEDDPVRVQNVLHYYLALASAKVSAELHVYPTGGHGYGLRNSGEAVTKWPSLVETWLRGLHVIPPAGS